MCERFVYEVIGIMRFCSTVKSICIDIPKKKLGTGIDIAVSIQGRECSITKLGLWYNFPVF